jgi:RHS repeat-associated protein
VPETPKGGFASPTTKERATAVTPSRAALVEAETSPTRAVYAGPGGSRLAVLTASPVRFQDDAGRWQDIDPNVVPAPGGGFTPAAMAAPPVLAGDAGAPAQLASAAGPIGLSHPDAARSGGVADRDRVVYADALAGGADLEHRVTAEGIEESVVVPTAAGPSSYVDRFDLPPGVSARQAEGGVEFVGGDGTVVGRFVDGVAFDSAASPATTRVSVQLAKVGPSWVTVTVSVDADWFADPPRVFPVTIDPSWTQGTTTDSATFVQDGTSGYGLPELWVGTTDGGAHVARTLLSYNGTFSGWVTEAHIRMQNTYSPSCVPRAVDLYGVTGIVPEGQQPTWANQPGLDSWGVISSTSFAKGSAGCSSGYVNLDATQAVQRWARHQQPNLWFELRAHDESDNTNFRKFKSATPSTNSEPILFVTYSTVSPPAVPQAPDDGARLGPSTPKLTFTTFGGAVSASLYKFRVRVTTGRDAESGAVADSGWQQVLEEGLPTSGCGASGCPDQSWTVPAGVLREGSTYFWHVWTSVDGGATWSTPTWARSFKVVPRSGDGPTTAAFDTIGPARVNLVTGNLSVTTGSVAFPSVGGSLGVTYRYDSLAPSARGLSGSYVADLDQDRVFDATDPTLAVRRDPQVSFDWLDGSPFPGLDPDWFLGRWTGQVTVPTSGSYLFGASRSDTDGVRVWVNDTLVLDGWNAAASPGPIYGSPATLSAGVPVPIRVEYSEGSAGAAVALFVKGAVPESLVPATWLSPGVPPVLPHGWTMSGAPELGYTGAEVLDGSVNLIDTAGVAHTYLATDRGYVPPAGEDGVLAVSAQGELTFQEPGGGATYVFDPAGNIVEATIAADDRHPAAPTYTFAGTPARLVSTTDPVSGRQVRFRYSPDPACPSSPPPGFDAAAPASMLCSVTYPDGTITKLWYVAGQFARLEDPGAVITDFAYSGGLLTEIRTPLAADAIAAGVRADDATARTVIGYQNGRVASVTLPAPTPGAPRPEHTYQYTYQSPPTGTPNPTSQRFEGITLMHVTGLTEPVGHARRILFRDYYDGAPANDRRLIQDEDGDNRSVTTTWDAADRVIEQVDTTRLKTTTEYDQFGLPLHVWGPADPANWLPGDIRPSYKVPHTTTFRDEGLQGLAATYWANTDLLGTPVAHDTGVGDPTGALSANWGTSGLPAPGLTPGGWTGRYTGLIRFSTGTNNDLVVDRSGYVRVWVDDRLVIDNWFDAVGDSSETFDNPVDSALHRIRIDYRPGAAGARLKLRWARFASQPVPGTALAPGYGLETSTSTDQNAFVGQTRATAYADAAAGLVGSTTLDPAGAALTTSVGSESGPDGYRRRISRTLPAGNTWTYGYYGDTEARDNPCTTLVDAVSQAGAPKLRTGPDPDGTGPETPRVEENVYDLAGRLVATRIGTDPWTCTTYDNRGRPATVEYPAFGAEPARTVSYDYQVGGNPLVSSVTDPAGTITTTVDLLGRVIAYTDVWGNTTSSTYDRPGRLTDTTGPAGALHRDYTAAGKVTAERLDGQTLAVPTYSATTGLLESVSYPAGTGNAGNGTSGTFSVDMFGRPSSVTWNQPGGVLMARDQVTRNLAGNVIDQMIDGVDPRPSNDNFTYDGAGRLVDAWAPGHHYTYAFDAAGGCGTLPTAGANTNRTASTDNGAATTYCYDQADKLTATTAAGYGTLAYDSHGNTTALGAQTLTYDSAHRHITSAEGATTVGYLRDATGRIVARSLNGVTQARYGFTGGSDGAGFTQDATGAVIERTFVLVGGALLTKRASGDVWSYPNIHGDVIATANAAGVKQGTTLSYDPYGNPLGTIPDNAAGGYDYGWLGQHQRGLEQDLSLNVIEMGARPYAPELGRFLQTDPIEGGSCNDYDYVCGDPIDSLDLDGLAACSLNDFNRAAYAMGYGGVNPGKALMNGGWKCSRYASKWAAIPNSGSHQAFCTFPYPAGTCTERLRTEERWVDLSLTAPNGGSVVVSIHERRKLLRTCGYVAGVSGTGCTTYYWNDGAVGCSLSWEGVKIRGRSSGDRGCY